MKKYFDLEKLNVNQPRDIKNYQVIWEDLVQDINKIEITDYEYLVQIQNYTNNVPPGGIFAYNFTYREDKEFERLLEDLYLPQGLDRYNESIEPQFIGAILSKTNFYTVLSEYANSCESLSNRIIEAYKQDRIMRRYDTHHLIESTLCRYLYSYGMYDFFYNDHTLEEAKKITLDFTDAIFENNYDNTLYFDFYGPWNDWFDEHSCTDRSFLLINKIERKVWVLCFSHSD